MSELCVLAASVVLQSQGSNPPPEPPLPPPLPLTELDREPSENAHRCHQDARDSTAIPSHLPLAAPTSRVEFSSSSQLDSLTPVSSIAASSDAVSSSAIAHEQERMQRPRQAQPSYSVQGVMNDALYLSQVREPSLPDRDYSASPTTDTRFSTYHSLSTEGLAHERRRPVTSSPTAAEDVSSGLSSYEMMTAGLSHPQQGWPSLLAPYRGSGQPLSRPTPTQATPARRVRRSPTTPLAAVRPQSTSQLFQQRRAALQAGQTYTRLGANSFESQWRDTTYNPTYEDWLGLLAREARSMAGGQGSNRLSVIVGDSLSMWMPTEFLPRHRFWLNQAISGETAEGMLKRLHAFDQTRPDTIHVMAGINDLKRGASDVEVLGSLRMMMRQLRSKHPQAQIIIHSILPTRLPHLASDRIRGINQRLAQITLQEGAQFLDLQRHFTDHQGHLRADFTTDGLHLNYRGYTMWQSVMRQFI